MPDSTEESVVNILCDFKNGSLSSEECFCMLLSLLGEEKIRVHFRFMLGKGGLTENSLLFNQLKDLHRHYFAFNETNQRLENVEQTSSFGDELDLELAVALSVADSDTKLSSATSSASPRYVAARESEPTAPKDCEKWSQQLRLPDKSYSSQIKTGLSASRRDPTVGVGVHQLKKDALSCKNLSGSSSSDKMPTEVPENITESQTSKRKKRKKKTQQQHILSGIVRPLCSKPVLYWLRRDLRLHDNPALVAAFESNAPVIVVFLWNEKEEGPLAAGGATKYWLHFALTELNKSFQNEYSNRIVFRKTSDSRKEILSLVSEVNAGSVLMNSLYEPCLKDRDEKVSSSLTSKGVEVRRFHSYLLHEPDSVNTESLGMRGIGSVTHFMECCRQSSTQPIGVPLDKPSCLPASSCIPEGQALEQLGLAKLPRRKDGTIIDWAKTIRESWDFSEEGAWNALEMFVDEGIGRYEKESGRADMPNTSRISPYLHFGQVSPRAVLRHAQGLRSPKFLRKLAWRDLSYWLLSQFPDMPCKPMRVHYQNQRWSQNRAHLKAWQKGKTGYPLVDAAMRQLWLTGWMNNYTRHVVASFLISYLHLHWEHGYRWFQDTLLDADVAINAMMWQNGGMSGLDQWNFVMHPVDAALTCDPMGQYVRQWCPELSGLPDDFVHKPWKCPPSILRRAGVEIGKNYPYRVITDLEEAREQSLRDVVSVRRSNPQFVDPYTGNDLVPLPLGLLLPVITRREFKYKTAHPEAKDNPHSAVLRGYRSRKRDEAIAFANQVDFTASTVNECALRHQRCAQSNRFLKL